MADKYLKTCPKCGRNFYSEVEFSAHGGECVADPRADRILDKYRKRGKK